LKDKTFVSTTVTGHDLVAGSKVTLTFTESTLSAGAGCNTMNGKYTLDDSTLRWSGPVQSTMMGCPEGLAAQDQWLTTFLETGAKASMTGSLLKLTGGQTVMELEQQ
jgi:heat shock protein HslJ